MDWTALFSASAIATGISFSAQATTFTIDLTDSSFTPNSVEYLFPETTGPIYIFGETVGGVNFIFTSPGLAAQNFSTMGPWSGGEFETGNYALPFGGAGNSPASFTLSADADVSLTSFVGFNQQFNNAAIFDVKGPGVSSSGNGFTGVGFLERVSVFQIHVCRFAEM